MSQEIVTVAPVQSLSLADQIKYAELVATGSLLPQAYRGNPANVLLAVGLGQAMGLSPAESLIRIDVINGTPAAGAELIASNVRKAGHKLRIQVTENPPAATCTIVRSDDPDYPITVTRDMAWAERMKLSKKENYLTQPATMLANRAITGAARLACPEALFGVAYDPSEFRDSGAAASVLVESAAAPAVTAADFIAAPAEDIQDAEVVEEETGEAITAAQRRAMFAAFTDAGFETDAKCAEGKAARLGYIGNVLGREVDSTNDLTSAEASRVLDALRQDATPPTYTTSWQEAGE